MPCIQQVLHARVPHTCATLVHHAQRLKYGPKYSTVQRLQIALARRASAILVVFEKIYSCLFNSNCTRNHVITYTCSNIQFPSNEFSYTVSTPFSASLFSLFEEQNHPTDTINMQIFILMQNLSLPSVYVNCREYRLFSSTAVM